MEILAFLAFGALVLAWLALPVRAAGVIEMVAEERAA